jgi:transposase
MKKPAPSTPREKQEIEQLSQAELVEMVLVLQKIIASLTEKLAIAQGKGKSNSQNSSKPPSTDLIQKSENPTAKAEEEKQKRKPRGQPGHQGTTRKGFGRVDRREVIHPEICQCCGSRELSTAINQQTQQVACLVAKPIEVVEYQTAKCQCLECGAVVSGSLPSGIVPGQDLSIELQALLVWLGNYGHMSYAKQQELLWELGSIEVGVGTLQKTNQRVASAVEPAIDSLWEWATFQPNVHVDETPWCVMGVKEWLAKVFLELIDEAFKQHRKWRENRELLTYHQWAVEFKARLNQALQTWLGKVGYFGGLLLKSLRDKADQWWYFLNDPSVPPDNNLAERSLRLAVTKRKVSGGSRSMKRFEQTADILSVIQSCRFQARSVMTFFREAISAHSCDLAMPSLIPLS